MGGDFRKGGGGRFGGRGGGFNRRDGGRGGSGRNDDRGPARMHQAVCDQCGKPCEVPFQPITGKPVYCTACFESRRDGENNRSGDRFSQKSRDSRDSYAPIAKQGIENSGSTRDTSELKKQLELLNAKMDRLVKLAEDMVGGRSFGTKVGTKKRIDEPVKAPSLNKVKKSAKKVSRK